MQKKSEDLAFINIFTPHNNATPLLTISVAASLCRARPQTWKIWHKMPKYVGYHILGQRLFFNKRKRGTFNIYLLALPRTYKFASKGISSLRLGPLSVSPGSCFNVFSMSVRPSLLEHPLCHRGFSENCIVRSVRRAAAY